MQERYQRDVPLPPDLVLRMTSRVSLEELRDEIETQAGAYVDLDTEGTFLGTVLHPLQLPPPYTQKRSHTIAHLEAVNRIGMQWHHWRLLRDRMLDGSMQYRHVHSSNMIAINGNNQVPVVVNPQIVYELAQKRGDERARYPAYVKELNYLGDSDFWGNFRPGIFPMSVRVQGRPYDRVIHTEVVNKEWLGITQHQIDSTWEAWHGLFRALDESYHTATIQLIDEKAFEPLYLRLAQEVVAHEQIVSGAYRFTRYMLLERKDLISVDPRVLEEYIFVPIGDRIKQTIEEDRNSPVIAYSQSLVDHLEDMYSTAQQAKGDTY